MKYKKGPKISTYNGRMTQHVYCNGREKQARTGLTYMDFVGTLEIGGKLYNVVLKDMGNGVVGTSERGHFIKVDVSPRRAVQKMSF